MLDEYLSREMGKQRDGFKEEIRNLKNDMKSSENKHEVYYQLTFQF